MNIRSAQVYHHWHKRFSNVELPTSQLSSLRLLAENAHYLQLDSDIFFYTVATFQGVSHLAEGFKLWKEGHIKYFI